jgi:hypothetical protein
MMISWIQIRTNEYLRVTPTSKIKQQRRFVSLSVTRQVTLVEQKLLSLPEHLSSTHDLVGVHVTQSV